MPFYPPPVQERFASPQHSGAVDGANATGKSASFQCGSFISFSIFIDPITKTVVSTGFGSNGCGYMIAAADVLAESVKAKNLGDLHGLESTELIQTVEAELGVVPAERQQCIDVCLDALREAFADFRKTQIEEFSGEKALVCTCFGVSEDTIETHIRTGSIETVDQVTAVCNAGGGCGACRMLIQEMIDTAADV